MPLREDILEPIAGPNPGGVDIRYDTTLALYDKIKEARRQDDGLAQGEWQHERKVADFALVIDLTQEGLTSKSKDLQLAAWLTEGLLHTEGFSGLRQGLLLCRDLVERFWDNLYPPLEDGEAELRAAALDWLGRSLEAPVKGTPLVLAGYDWFKFKETSLVKYETQAQTDSEKKTRNKLLAEGKLAPELFDKAFAETPKSFYARSERDLDGCLESLKGLDGLCGEKFGDVAPSFGKLKIAIEEVRHTVHLLLEKKRELEPDPPEQTPPAGTEELTASPDAREIAPTAAQAITIPVGSFEPPGRREAIAAIAKAAAFLRNREPHNPAPYLMLRGLRWGELRATAKRFPDVGLLEAPSTELRQHIKRLALDGKWKELLETAEDAMSLPCGRAWLDLQRFVIAACTALGDEYSPIAAAIRSELKNLICDLPELLEVNLLDDTPAANPETRAWLNELNQTAPPVPDVQNDGTEPPKANHDGLPSWLEKQADPYIRAQEAVKDGQSGRAFEIMQKEIARQRSGRGRFQRTLQLVQICMDGGNESIAQPFIDDLAAAIEAHKLEGWEENEMVAAALATILKVSKKMQANAAERDKLFERICRLDPARALKTG